MTTYLGKSCSFGLLRVPFVNCRQFMYLVISLLVLRAGCGIWLYQFLIIAYLFTFSSSVLTAGGSEYLLFVASAEGMYPRVGSKLQLVAQRRDHSNTVPLIARTQKWHPTDSQTYTNWQKKCYNQNQSCFIPAVISSNYIEIYETKNARSIVFWRNLKLYAVVPSNWRKPWPKFDVTDATFEFPEDLDTLKD